MSSRTSRSSLARRYATALFELAKEKKLQDKVEKDLLVLQEMLAVSADFSRLIKSPVISKNQLSGALEALLAQAKVEDITGRFAKVLSENRRAAILPEVVEAYTALMHDYRGELTGEVVSAVPLKKDVATSLEKSLAKTLGKKVKLQNKVDPDILGGLVVRVGSVLYDDSINNKLERLKLSSKGDMQEAA